MPAVQSSRSRAAPRLSLLMLILASLQAARASYLTGSGFPWEGCKSGASYNRWTLNLASYTVKLGRSSRVCFRFGAKDPSDCTDSGLRCCGENNVNKMKIYIDPLCERMDITDITVNGRYTSAAFREFQKGDIGRPSFKITNMNIPFNQLSSTTLCLTLQGKCATLSALANPVTRAQGLLEVGLYDVKSYNYECCPMFVFPVNGTAST